MSSSASDSAASVPTQVIRVSGFPFFVYPVRDMAVSRRFYGGVLGLQEGDAWGDQWVEFEVPDSAAAGNPVLALSTMMSGVEPGTRGGAVALETADFDGAMAALRTAGVQVLVEPADSGVCRFARFTDPDGNHLFLHRKHTS